MEAAPVGQNKERRKAGQEAEENERLRLGAAPGWWDNHMDAGELVVGMERRRLMVVGSEGQVGKWQGWKFRSRIQTRSSACRWEEEQR